MEKFKWGIKSGTAVIAFLISDMMFAEIYALFLMHLNMEEYRLRILFQTGSALITLVLAFPVFTLVMRCWGKLQKFHIKGNGLSIWNYPAYALLAMAPVAFLGGMEIFLLWQGRISPEDLRTLTPENVVYTLLVSCLLLPVMEEIMFRGILLHKLLPLGTGYAILLTTCFFVAIHYNNPANMILSLATGLILAHMTVKAGGILPAVIFHIGINLLGQIILPAVILSLL